MKPSDCPSCYYAANSRPRGCQNLIDDDNRLRQLICSIRVAVANAEDGRDRYRFKRALMRIKAMIDSDPIEIVVVQQK